LGYTGGGDPSLSFDAQGDLCYGYMAGNPGPANSTYVNGIFAARIDPKTGVIEENQRVARETATSDHDKAWIAADDWVNRNNVYLVWPQFGPGTDRSIMSSRSMDRGASWSPPVQLNKAGEGFVWPSEVAVARNGDVWVAWHAHGAETGTTGEILMRRSIDGG